MQKCTLQKSLIWGYVENDTEEYNLKHSKGVNQAGPSLAGWL